MKSNHGGGPDMDFSPVQLDNYMWDDKLRPGNLGDAERSVGTDEPSTALTTAATVWNNDPISILGENGARTEVTSSDRSAGITRGQPMNSDDILKSYMDNVSAQVTDLKEAMRTNEDRANASIDRLSGQMERQVDQIRELVQKQGEQLQKSIDKQEERFIQMTEAQERRFSEALSEVREDFKETNTKVEAVGKSTKWNTLGLYIGIASMVVAMVIGFVSLTVSLTA